MLTSGLYTQTYPQNCVYMYRSAVSGFEIKLPDLSTLVAGVVPGLCDHMPFESSRYQWKSRPGAITSATL